MHFLRASDLGAASDYRGSLFYYITMTKIPGQTKMRRRAELITVVYDANGAQSRLPKLMPTMLRAEANRRLKSSKLRAKAGEARALIPCQSLLARNCLDPSERAEATMISASGHLSDVYSCLSRIRSFCYLRLLWKGISK